MYEREVPEEYRKSSVFKATLSAPGQRRRRWPGAERALLHLSTYIYTFRQPWLTIDLLHYPLDLILRDVHQLLLHFTPHCLLRIITSIKRLSWVLAIYRLFVVVSRHFSSWGLSLLLPKIGIRYDIMKIRYIAYITVYFAYILCEILYDNKTGYPKQMKVVVINIDNYLLANKFTCYTFGKVTLPDRKTRYFIDIK